MTLWPRRIRAAVGMGLIWGVGWAIVGGAIMEGIVDPHGKILDMWPQTLAIILSAASAIASLALARLGNGAPCAPPGRMAAR